MELLNSDKLDLHDEPYSCMMCSQQYDPVCANGKEFSNACMAKSSNVFNYTKGRCEKVILNKGEFKKGIATFTQKGNVNHINSIKQPKQQPSVESTPKPSTELRVEPNVEANIQKTVKEDNGNNNLIIGGCIAIAAIFLYLTLKK